MNERVLIIDDEPDVLKTIDTILTNEGFQVISALSGEDGINSFQSIPFDLVITDIRMPGMDGLEIIKQIKQLDEDMEVIVLTGYATLENAIQALSDNGAFEYLTKPLENIDELSNAIKRAMEKRRLRRENKKKTAELAKANEELRVEIAKHKRIEQALCESEEKYRLLVDNASDAIFIAQDKVVKFPNPKAEELTGYTKEELAKIPFVDLVHPEDRDLVLERHNRRLKGEKPPSTYSFRVINKAGEEFWAHLNTVLITWEGRTATLNFLRDITKQKRLESQLQHAQKMEAIGTLAGGIAHDFNNLLMGIQGRTSLMLIDIDSTHDHFEHLKGIEDYVRSASDLTKQLLGFARGGKYEARPTDLKGLINKTSQMFGRTKKEITIHEKYQSDIWTVEVDQGQIEQALLNLYVNAWQAMPSGGRLYIQVENVTIDENSIEPFDVKPGTYVKISVTDTGVGMDEATQQKIFDPFFTTKEMGRGTGLGLATVYGIVKNHGGIINVHSEKGEGSTFNIYLPKSEKESIQETELPEKAIKGKGIILLVDDEDMIIDVGERMLRKMGYKALLARSGKEAIDLYEKNKEKIDIVILDMIMPDMNGGDTYDRMKEINPDVKILLSSGYSVHGQAGKILERGCDGFINKPYTIKQLSHKISEILDKKAAP